MLLVVVKAIMAASFLRKEVILSFRIVWPVLSANFVLFWNLPLFCLDLDQGECAHTFTLSAWDTLHCLWQDWPRTPRAAYSTFAGLFLFNFETGLIWDSPQPDTSLKLTDLQSPACSFWTVGGLGLGQLAKFCMPPFSSCRVGRRRILLTSHTQPCCSE